MAAFLNPVSTQDLDMVGYVFLAWSSSRIPMAFSERLAAVTITARRSPSVSVMMPRSLPTIFLAASVPWLFRGTLVDVLTLWVSITEAVGSGLRPSFTRARPVRS
jgi:hypothetical protein